MTESAPNRPTVPGRGQFLLLAALFFVPLFAAYLLYFVVPGMRPSGTTNYGVLLPKVAAVPALSFTDADGKTQSEDAFKHHWSVVYMAGTSCDDACLARVIMIRQVRLLLADERPRLKRIYITPDAASLQAARTRFGSEQPDLVYLADTAAPGQRAADFFKPTDPNALYLIDPLGNWLMVYPSDKSDYKLILKDIKRLLKLSMIG
jgi:cytochrome oxidase Cu insertion factor (SCO1/SenC/PrrC family)